MPVTLRVHAPRHRRRRPVPTAALPFTCSAPSGLLRPCSTRTIRATGCPRRQRPIQQFQQ